MQSSFDVTQNIPAVAILVPSCDSYSDLWQPFFQCLFKYWPDCPFPLYLGANTISYPDPRVRSILVGEDKDYSSNLAVMLQHVPYSYVLLWIEDRVLSETLDTAHLLRHVRSFMDCGGGYFKLIANHPIAAPDKGKEFAALPKSERYRASITVALWRKEVLLSLLRPGESAWELETNGSKRSAQLDVPFFALTREGWASAPIRDEHLIIKGSVRRKSLTFLDKEGLRAHLSSRVIQNRYSSVYERLFITKEDVRYWWRRLLTR